MLRAVGVLATTFLIGLSTVPVASADDENAVDYCHGATDFKGCMQAERDGLIEEVGQLQQNVKLESATGVWLILIAGEDHSTFPLAMHAIRTIDIEQCEEQGAVWISSKRITRKSKYLGFECLEGK